MKSLKKTKKAFTLVEIMIVVAIIGILATIAVPAFQQARNKTLQKAVLNNLRQLASAGQQYLLDQGVTTCNYTNLVGTETTKYIRTIPPVADETYTSLVIETTGTLTATVAGVTVTYAY